MMIYDDIWWYIMMIYDDILWWYMVLIYSIVQSTSSNMHLFRYAFVTRTLVPFFWSHESQQSAVTSGAKAVSFSRTQGLVGCVLDMPDFVTAITLAAWRLLWGLSMFQWHQDSNHVGMDQYLLIPFLGGWTSIYQLFWCSPGVQGFDTLPCDNRIEMIWHILCGCITVKCVGLCFYKIIWDICRN